MSLILDALNRADRENRKPDSSPNLETEHEQPVETSNNSSNLPWYILGGVVFVVLGLGLFLFLNDSILNNLKSPTEKTQANTTTNTINNTSNSPAEKNTAQSDDTNKTSVLALQSSEANSTEGSPSKVTERSSTQIKTPQQAPNKAERLRQGFIQAQYEQQNIKAANTASKTKAPAEPQQQKQITGLYQQPTVTSTQEKSSAEQLPASIGNQYEKVKKQTQKNRVITQPNQISTTSDNQLEFYGHIGSIRDLPFQAQEKIPSMMYTEHNNKRKSVTINGKEYKEKSTLAPDLIVEKILVDGIILKYQKYTFKVRAYNNWINL